MQGTQLTIEGVNPESTMPRPKRNEDAIVRAAAEKIAEDCVRWDPNSKAEDWVEDLFNARGDWNDGYALCKELERYARIDPDSELVQILDGAMGHHCDAHEDAVKKWVKIVGFTPQHQVGDVVVTRRGEGKVYEIYAETAQYVVDTEGRGNGGLIVNAEDLIYEDNDRK